MTDTIRIERWSVTFGERQEYVPPEGRSVFLAGEVYGHPRKPDGECVVTSRIVDAIGRTVTTASGSVYLLGEVDPAYLKHCRETGYEIDPNQPIVMKGLR